MNAIVPLDLTAAVTFQGSPAVIVGRSKPVGADWKYDVRVGDEIKINVRGDELGAPCPIIESSYYFRTPPLPLRGVQ